MNHLDSYSVVPQVLSDRNNNLTLLTILRPPTIEQESIQATADIYFIILILSMHDLLPDVQ